MEMIEILNKLKEFEQPFTEDDMQDLAIHDIEAQLGKINDEITFLQIDQKDKESALAALGELRSVLDKYQSQQESAVTEAKFKPEVIAQLKAWAKKYDSYFGKNGDDLPSGWVKGHASTGITSDGYDDDEIEQWEKKFGKDENDWEAEEHEEFQKKSKITGGMIRDLGKIIGPDNVGNEEVLVKVGHQVLGMDFGDYGESTQKEGNEFALAVQKAKAAGMKPGDEFEVGGKKYTLKDAIEQAGLQLEEFFSEDEMSEAEAEPKKCDHCDGTGKHGDKDCEVCGGRGFITEFKQKPDFLDLDKDGNTKEPMKSAADDAKLNVSKADKALNTPAYQKMKAGDPKYADKTNEVVDILKLAGI